LFFLANLGIRGKTDLPTDEIIANNQFVALTKRLEDTKKRFEALASSRTGNESLLGDVVDLLLHWFIHGKPTGAEKPG
jgi:hypothetical protein